MTLQFKINRDPSDTKSLGQNRRNEEQVIAEPLDSTHIHSEDYGLARKMATDTPELDEEDVHDEHPPRVVTLIMADDDNVKKLDEHNMDDFAINMYENHVATVQDYVKKGQTLPAVILDVKINLQNDTLLFELFSSPQDVSQGDGQYRRVAHDTL
ncbi:hypothetical protein EIP86_005810 [Pleurotus ostreatoroseus]|nr:hypothetical protein EIP86_005810 [Pleurotus ostreatoroseus]